MLTSSVSCTMPSPKPTVRAKSKRGRKSVIPPEQREHVRRIKKQDMERKRRACISDKMNALHTLAMSLIGEDAPQCQKTEKADILNVCYQVFYNLVSIVKETPDIRYRVQQFGNQLRDGLSPEQSVSTISSPQTDKENCSTPGTIHPYIAQAFPPHPTDSLPSGTPETTHSWNTQSDRSQSTDSGIFTPDYSSHRQKNLVNPTPNQSSVIRLPLKHRFSINKQGDFPDPSHVSPTDSATVSRTRHSVWRPYLD